MEILCINKVMASYHIVILSTSYPFLTIPAGVDTQGGGGMVTLCYNLRIGSY